MARSVTITCDNCGRQIRPGSGFFTIGSSDWYGVRQEYQFCRDCRDFVEAGVMLMLGRVVPEETRQRMAAKLKERA